MTSKLSKSWMLGAAVGAVALMGLSPQANADLSMQLAFSDGTTTRTLTAADVGTDISFDVWVTVTGADGNNLNDGIGIGYYNILSGASAEGMSALGNLNGYNNNAAPGFQIADKFNALGVFIPGNTDLNADGIKDIGLSGVSPKSGMAMYRPNTGSASWTGADVQSWSAADGQLIPDGIKVRVATLSFHVDSLVGGAASGAATTFNVVTPTNPAPFPATWTGDGVLKHTLAAIGAPLTFLAEGGAVGNNSNIVLQSPTGSVSYNLLAGGSLDVPVVSQNTGTDAANPVDVSVAPATGFSIGGSPLTIAGGATGQVNLHIDGSAAGGSTVVTVHNATPGVTDPDDTLNVAVGSVGSAAPGEHLMGTVQPGGSYAGLMSSVNGGKGTNAVIVAGTHEGTDPTNVDESWGLASDIGVANFGPGLGPNPEFISEVLDLAGTAPDMVVLGMTYDDSGFVSERNSAVQQHIQIVSFDAANNVWVPTTSLNSDGQSHFMGLIDAASTDFASWQLGSWGVDVNTNQVFAAIDHNSQFAVVPEPATLSLLGLSALGLLARRRRHA